MLQGIAENDVFFHGASDADDDEGGWMDDEW